MSAAESMPADPSRPIVPGHEIAGVIDAVGAQVTAGEVLPSSGPEFLERKTGFEPATLTLARWRITSTTFSPVSWPQVPSTRFPPGPLNSPVL